MLLPIDGERIAASWWVQSLFSFALKSVVALCRGCTLQPAAFEEAFLAAIGASSQCYTGWIPLAGFPLRSDLFYIWHFAERLMMCMLEVTLNQGHPSTMISLLAFMKSVRSHMLETQPRCPSSTTSPGRFCHHSRRRNSHGSTASTSTRPSQRSALRRSTKGRKISRV
jgi:hypothetical protein